MRAVGLTDHGTFAGAIQMLKLCRKANIENDGPPVKPIIGMESYLCKNRSCHKKECQPDGRKGNKHLNIIAKNLQGYHNLCNLSQKASLEGMYYDPRIDFDLLNEYKDGLIITSACFLGDQWVNTGRGLCRIDEVSLSDYVINSSGKYINPIAITSREYRGDIYKIKAKGHFGVIQCTEDHRILVDNGLLVKWVKAKDIDESYRLLSPVIPLSENADFNLWDKVNDFYFWKSRIKGISNKPLYISPELCLFCGLWLSEGHVSTGGRVGFTFSNEEMKWAKFIEKFISDEFGLDCNISERPENHRIDVSICSEELSRLLKCYFGSKSDGKFISHWFKTANKECRSNLLIGSIIGDGSFKSKSFGKYDKMVYASISRSLLSDLRDIAISLGVRVTSSSVRSRVDNNNVRHRKSYYLFAYGEDARKLHRLVEGEKLETNEMNMDSRNRKIGKNTKFVEFEGNRFLSMPIRSIDVTRNIQSKVYCLSENETQSFSADGIVVHNCLSNIVNWHLKHDRYEKAKKAATLFKDIFEDDYYLEIMFHGIPEEGKIIPDIQKLSKELNIKTIITNDSHYLEPEDADPQEVMMCMSGNRCIKDPNRMKFPYQEFYFKTKEQMYDMFKSLPVSLNNTIEIAEKCDYSDLLFVEEGGPMRLPKFELPEGYSNPYIYLKDLAKTGIRKLGWDKSPEHVARLKLELQDIELIYNTKRYDFSTYFLIVWDMMQFARKKGIATGIRGSGYGSVLVFCLGIGEGIDPLAYDLLWERFLGFDEAFFFSPDDFGIRQS